ncbi:uncharacterized protein [Diadema antillarum]|uniref:uncharacterized protein n=1 Tax=Diadema antillarum TaxID=105358 RepID=UPI003A84D83D
MTLGNTFSSSSTLVLWHENVVDGESYRAGLVTLDANYSLVINRVDEDDAGRYYCNVTDYRGILIGNYTDVSVRDFLSVKGCSNTNCSLIYDRQDSGLLCQARNVPQDLVNIYWLHDESEVSDIAYHFSKYNNGTQNIDAKIPISTGVQGVFTCVAESQSTQDELQRIAVTITMTPTSPTITDSITSSKSKGRLVALIVSIIAGVLLGVTCLAKWLVGKGKREPEINQSRYSGSITYLELWEMCSKINNYQGLAKALTQFLMGDDCQLVIPPKDMYNGLCRWKEKTEEEIQLSQFSPNKIIQKAMEEYRSKQGEISHDDISHICWSVDKQPQRLEKLLNELGITQIDLELEAKRAKVEKCSALLAEWISAETQRTSSNVNEGEDIELKEMRVTEDEKKEKRPVIGGQNEERTPVIVGKKSELTLMEEDKKEEQRTGKENKEQQQTTVKEKYINFMVTLCLALENTGCKEVAKTFFQISEKNKKPLDKESIETVALAITKRHFVSLSRETHMKPEDVDARNRENLEWMFRTDKLLEDWVSSQKCSNYEIRCRLREAVEKCDRKDVADTCIQKDQCAIYDEKEPSVAIQNEQARPTGIECRAYKSSTGNGVGSINDLSNDAKNSVEDAPSEKTALLSQTKDQNTEETEEKSCSNESEEGKYDNKDNAEDPSECQTAEQNDTESGLPTLEEQGDVEAASAASTEGEEDVGKVSSITKEEIQLIRKYADPEVVRSIAIDLRLDNPESVDDMDIVLALERERGRRRAGQRERIRKALKKTIAKYEELLAEKGYNEVFKAEIPRLARRLLMTDHSPAGPISS